MPRLVAISDTHRLHDRIDVPDGDVVVHAGDFCGHGRLSEALAFIDWFAALPHPHKVVIAGNHDRCLEKLPAGGAQLFPSHITYLFDSAADVAGLRFYGSPWQPAFFDWAFNLPRGSQLREKWAQIPADVDVLITHGPPQGVLDESTSGEACGCADLLQAVRRVKPKLHLFGHIHEGYGTEMRDGTLFVNASTCTVSYRPDNPPIVVDLAEDGVSASE